MGQWRVDWVFEFSGESGMVMGWSRDRAACCVIFFAAVCALSACGGSASSGDSSGIALDKRATATASQTSTAASPDQAQSDLITGISPTTREASFGEPQGAQTVADMTKRLAVVFDG
ncbi:hypothetical protein [Hydrogenophaga crassostreae]|uniref:hypothetical protein n=1 Tax=Hydrogenophaga crassostreae TaxID=1763535 RepID=UPI0012FA84CF|nr:hypothetical protein [Hydrogenophaga crassostreae]